MIIYIYVSKTKAGHLTVAISQVDMSKYQSMHEKYLLYIYFLLITIERLTDNLLNLLIGVAQEQQTKFHKVTMNIQKTPFKALLTRVTALR